MSFLKKGERGVKRLTRSGRSQFAGTRSRRASSASAQASILSVLQASGASPFTFCAAAILLWGIASEIAFTALLIYAPPLQRAFGTAALGITEIVFLLPFPLIVWGADELRGWLLGRRAIRSGHQRQGAGAGFGLG
jgi:hypothetical protein